MPAILNEIDSAIRETEQVRSRHDGVHLIHTCITSLLLCRSVAEADGWSPLVRHHFNETMRKVRYIDHMGFPPHDSIDEDLSENRLHRARLGNRSTHAVEVD